MSLTITFSEEAVTYGGETVTFGGEDVTYQGSIGYAWARTRDISGEYDRLMYRPPFSEAWRQAGDGKPNPETIRVTVEVDDADAAEDLIVDAEEATSLEGVFWRGSVEGLVNAVTVRRQRGYAITLEWLTVTSPSLSVLVWDSWGDTSITFSELEDVTFAELD